MLHRPHVSLPIAELLPLLDALRDEARALNATPAQLAIAWLLRRGPDLVPIPGTTSTGHLDELIGAMDVVLDEATMSRLDALINARTVSGERYNAATQAEIDTERF